MRSLKGWKGALTAGRYLLELPRNHKQPFKKSKKVPLIWAWTSARAHWNFNLSSLRKRLFQGPQWASCFKAHLLFLYFQGLYEVVHNMTAPTWYGCAQTALRTVGKHAAGCIGTNGSSLLRAGASSLIRSDFISLVPRITMPARQRMAWGRRGRATTLAERKSGVNEGWEERE